MLYSSTQKINIIIQTENVSQPRTNTTHYWASESRELWRYINLSIIIIVIVNQNIAAFPLETATLTL